MSAAPEQSEPCQALPTAVKANTTPNDHPRRVAVLETVHQQTDFENVKPLSEYKLDKMDLLDLYAYLREIIATVTPEEAKAPGWPERLKRAERLLADADGGDKK